MEKIEIDIHDDKPRMMQDRNRIIVDVKLNNLMKVKKVLLNLLSKEAKNVFHLHLLAFKDNDNDVNWILKNYSKKLNNYNDRY